MNCPYRLFLAAASVAVSIFSNVYSQDGADLSYAQDLEPLLPTEKARVERASPQAIQVAPKQPRRVLVFTLNRNNGEIRPGHPSIAFSNYFFEMIGERTRAFAVDFSRDPADLALENLRRYDALVFNNTAGVLTDDEELRQGVLDYVFQGGGFMGTHAAAATFCQWPDYDIFPEFGLMLGGFESGGHPWKPHEWITLKIDDPDHPVSYGFRDFDFFDVSDEVFQFTDPYSRHRVRVLVSIDPARTDMSEERYILPERRADLDLAISWVRRYGRGRVFYTALGHNTHTMWNPPILQHYLDGLQFALGDLEAPSVPSAKLTPAREAQERLGWRFGVSAYSFRDKTLLETIDQVNELGLAYVGSWNEQKVSDEIDKPFDYHLSDEEIRVVRDHLAAKGVTMLTHFVFDLPGDEAECRKIFEFGRKIGVECFLSEPKVENLDLVERLAEEYQIKVGLHNHGSRLSPIYMRPENILEICEGRSPLIGAACDFGYWIREGIDPYEAVQVLGDRIITLQVHDQNEASPEGHDVPWGTGVIRLDAIFEYLRNHDINPVMFGLEYSYNWGKSLPEIRQSVEYFDEQSMRLAQP